MFLSGILAVITWGVVRSSESIVPTQAGLFAQEYTANPCKKFTNSEVKKSLKPGKVLNGLRYNYLKDSDAVNWSSSFLKPDGRKPKSKGKAYDEYTCKYSAFSAFDRDTKTAWSEGAKHDGIGEILIVNINPSKQVSIFAGFGRSKSLFKKNNRPKKVRVYLLEGELTGEYDARGEEYGKIKVVAAHEIILKDLFGFQKLSIPQGKTSDGISLIAIEILSVYKGTKYSDTLISEIKAK